jgi:hypothetical protein
MNLFISFNGALPTGFALLAYCGFWILLYYVLLRFFNVPKVFAYIYEYKKRLKATLYIIVLACLSYNVYKTGFMNMHYTVVMAALLEIFIPIRAFRKANKTMLKTLYTIL